MTSTLGLMSDSDEFYGELRLVRARLDAIEHTQDVLVRAERNQILPDIMTAFEKDPLLMQIYLLVDGVLTQQEIGRALQRQGLPGDKAAMVSRRLDQLYRDLHLVELVEHSGKGKIYRKAALDRILGITRQLERQRLAPAKNEDTEP
jgi:hypothetical protein